MKRYKIVAVAVFAFVLTGCAQIAVVSEKHPAALPPGTGANEIVTQTIDRGLAVQKSQPLAALGEFVSAARLSLAQLDRNPKNGEALRNYNFAIARMFSVIRNAKLDPWTHPLRIGVHGEFTLTWKRDPRPEWNLALYRLIPTDELSIKGTYVEERVTKAGIGAPLVAERALTPEQATRLFAPPMSFMASPRPRSSKVRVA